jgi:hypothetical protein
MKYLLAQKISNAVEKNNDENLGFLVRTILQAASAATEVADKRSWRTLPDKILMARLTLPPGDHSDLSGFWMPAGNPRGNPRNQKVTFVPGRKVFLIVRTAL